MHHVTRDFTSKQTSNIELEDIFSINFVKFVNFVNFHAYSLTLNFIIPASRFFETFKLISKQLFFLRR